MALVVISKLRYRPLFVCVRRESSTCACCRCCRHHRHQPCISTRWL